MARFHLVFSEEMSLVTCGLVVVLAAAGAIAWMTQPVRPAAGLAAMETEADPRRLEAGVRRLVGEFFPRDFGHPTILARAAAWISEELSRSGATVSEQIFTTNGQTYRNVIARFGPQTRDVAVVGAHYDTAGELPGADDNASGVAGLIEVARLLEGKHLSRTVELVAFTLEEMPFFGTGLQGSAVHARSLAKDGRSVAGMLCLEMIGCFEDAPGSQQFPFPPLRLFYPGRGNFIAVVGNVSGARLVRRVKRAMRRAAELPVCSINAPRWVPGIDLSDHASYWREGFPAVMVTDTAFYRNDRYHTAGDTPETLDYRCMARVVDGVLRAVLDLAGT
ncbi:MAG TPA: M28 family peptidase [Thermoanaerobaculia bacterium]|nr:M28 family peptidase [Thermoanaerobaculia bacterium]